MQMLLEDDDDAVEIPDDDDVGWSSDIFAEF